MDLKRYAVALRQHWLLAVLCFAVVLAVAVGITFTKKPTYASSTQLFIATSGAGQDNNQAAYQGGLFGQQRVKSYADIVSSQAVLQRVKDDLRLPDPISDLRAEITATAPVDTVLLDVTVTDRSKARATAIATSLGRQFADYVNVLETPQGQSVSPVKVTITEAPDVPSSPVTPKAKLNLALGLLLGLVVGASAALLRAAFDTRLRTKESVADIVGAPVLGGFTDDARVASQPLISDGDRFSRRSESYRQLRTAIRYLAVDKVMHSLVVTSSVAGEGKTTVATNLALSLAAAGERVILVDADLRRPSVGEVMGLNPQVGLTNVLVGSMPLDSALQPYREGLELSVLTSGELPPNPSELLGSQRMVDLLAELTARADVVVFDSPPLLPVTDAAVLAAAADGALLVSRARSTRRDQLAGSVEALRQVRVHVYGAVLNRLPSGGPESYSAYRYGYRPTGEQVTGPVAPDGSRAAARLR